MSTFHLRPGDTVLFEHQPCRVVRVSDSAAVIAITRLVREFTTLFGKRVRIQPKPALIRICANSEIPILNR